MATVSLLTGCAAMTAEVVLDLSTGEQIARINETPPCRIAHPIGGNSLIVDAGPVIFVQRCPGGGRSPWAQVAPTLAGPGHPSPPSRIFNFVAEPGRTYEVSDDCIRIASQDATTEGDIVVCEEGMQGSIKGPPIYKRYVCDLDYSKERTDEPYIMHCVPGQMKTAVIRHGGTTSNQDTCWPSAGSIKRRVILLTVEAGPINMPASCDRILETGELSIKTSSFDFDAETGHIYTLSGEDEECMRLLDITSEETVIACEPYQEIE